MHEWLADRISWIQYPGVSAAVAHPLFKWGMPWPTRMMLVLVGGLVLLLCAVALFFLGVLAWAAVTA